MSAPERLWRLGEAEVRGWVQDMVELGRTVIAPVEEDGMILFRPVESAQPVILDPGRPNLSPKEHLLPRTEAVYSFRLRGGGVEVAEPAEEIGQRVLLGVRPCDAVGLLRLDAHFLGAVADPFYARRRERTAVVTTACDRAMPECFCSAVGGSPLEEAGSDLQLVPLDGAWLLRPVTARGEALVSPPGEGWQPGSARDWRAALEQRARVEGGMAGERFPPGGAQLLAGAFDHPAWEEVGATCLRCGICAYVCPSCSCFDLNHDSSAWWGVQVRTWDSCAFAFFTRHASGHNPRPVQVERYRQRVLHKFCYGPLDHHGALGCVGCGRCVAQCPAGIDILESVRTVMAAARAEGGDGGAR